MKSKSINFIQNAIGACILFLLILYFEIALVDFYVFFLTRNGIKNGFAF
jgi:hypothetical protein